MNSTKVLGVIALALAVGVLGAVPAGAEALPWTLSLSGGYDLGLGTGYSWTTTGATEPTGTYYEQTRNALGNSGVHGEARWAGDLDQNWALAATVGIVADFPVLHSAYYFWSDGSVAASTDLKVNFAEVRGGLSGQYWLIRQNDLRLYGGLGAEVVVPSPMNVDEAYPDGTSLSSTQVNWGLGYGLRAELGGEALVEPSWGLCYSLVLEKVGLPRLKTTSAGTSSSTTVSYADKPKVNSSNQTAADAAQSTANQKYYTLPTLWDDLTDLSLQVGLVWHY